MKVFEECKYEGLVEKQLNEIRIAGEDFIEYIDGSWRWKRKRFFSEFTKFYWNFVENGFRDALSCDFVLAQFRSVKFGTN